MIIVRTPLRVSFFGGGTDHPAWFTRPEPGAVLSTTIDKYVYVQLRRLPGVFDFNYRIAWGMLEEVRSVRDIQHPVVRCILEHYNRSDETGYEIIYNADLPSRTGLGSSSAFTVALLHAWFGNHGRLCARPFLAREAIHVEQQLLGETVGSQDQIAAAYGGLNRIDFGSDGTFSVAPLLVPQGRREALQASLMLFFTGFSRSAQEVEKRKIAHYDERVSELRSLYEMVGEGERILLNPHRPLSEFGDLLHEAWCAKRSLDKSVSNSVIDEAYAAARAAGARGGKLLGAGGGGFLMMYVPLECQDAVREALRNLTYVPFRMEREGSSVVLYNPELASNYLAAEARVS
ncbi:GHMP family kinase ATP-binding protein [Roseicella aquatilis]|uniref:Kinase n=1 Tax=Roseicella aquatilis TaxID=2527868 RepID=A0A4R4DB71_9PROT|nr:kinase [Roseicella aquatilis]TCZ57276.1 kinase [Roseicella aquatilis]